MVRPTLLAAGLSLALAIAAGAGVSASRLALSLACVGGLAVLGPRRRRVAVGR